VTFRSDILLIGLLLVFVVLFTYIVTGFIRRYSLKNSLIDKPNERSSHTVPTPRGGGLSISVSILSSIVILMLANWLPKNIAVAMLGGGCLVTIIGWLDDHQDISALWRACSYLFAAIWALYFIGHLESINFGKPVIISVGLIISLLIALGIAWLINLYNFMDGTDGIAAIQAISTGAPAGVIFWINSQLGLAIICFVIVAACVGFLFWNWSPAKIFMGDVSSCLIGFMFAVLAIAGEYTNSMPIAVWLILLAVFIWDATFTLIRRILTGEKWYAAHRSHAYQRLTQLGISHSKLALSVLILNVIILWPLAYMAYKWDNATLYLLIVSIILMYILWLGIQVQYRARIPDMMGKPVE
jgi:glycosyltransferase WbpL